MRRRLLAELRFQLVCSPVFQRSPLQVYPEPSPAVFSGRVCIVELQPQQPVCSRNPLPMVHNSIFSWEGRTQSLSPDVLPSPTHNTLASPSPPVPREGAASATVGLVPALVPDKAAGGVTHSLGYRKACKTCQNRERRGSRSARVTGEVPSERP